MDENSFPANHPLTKYKTQFIDFHTLKKRKKQTWEWSEWLWWLWWISNNALDTCKNVFKVIWIFRTCYL